MAFVFVFLLQMKLALVQTLSIKKQEPKWSLVHAASTASHTCGTTAPAWLMLEVLNWTAPLEWGLPHIWCKRMTRRYTPAFRLISSYSSGIQHSRFEQVELRPPVHLSLDQLQAVESGKGATLLSLPPLRTARETFASCRSSLPNALLMNAALPLPTSGCAPACDIPGEAARDSPPCLSRRESAR